MSTYRRWKRLFLLGAATTTLAVILWATYLFTAIWLRVRAARELAGQAELLSEVTVSDQLESSESEGAHHLMFSYVLWDFVTRSHSALERLESLQRPNIATVLRHLLGRGRDESSADLEQAHAVAFDPQLQILATGESNDPMVQISNIQVQVGTQTGNFSLNVTASPGTVSSGQTLARAVMWEPGFDFQCFSVTDSHGEKVLIVTRPLPQDGDDEPTGESSPRPRELLLIDTAGRIFARRPYPGATLVGKLAEPHGKADQLVFGTRTHVNDQNGTLLLRVAGPGAVCIVEDGELKMIRSIDVPTAPKGKTPATESTESNSVDEMKR